MARFKPLAQIASVSAILIACTPESEAGAVAMVRDSSGIRIVENPAPPSRAAGVAASLGPLLVEIGEVSGRAAYQFSAVVGAVRLSNGGVLIADAESSEIRHFDERGAHLRSIGRAGQGPGEFRNLNSIVVAHDSIYAFDGLLGRINVFALDGAFGRTVALTRPEHHRGVGWTYRLHGVTHDRSFILLPAGTFAGLIGGRTGAFWSETGPALKYASDGAILEVIGENAGSDVYVTAERSSSLLLGRSTSAAFAGDRIYMTDGGLYELRSYLSGTTPEEFYRISRDPRPAGRPEREAFIARRLESLSEIDHPRARQIFEDIPHAEYLPWISAVQVDDLGYIWIQEYTPRREPSTWSVLDPTGELVGQIQLPESFVPQHIGADFILGVARTAADVPVVRQYSLARP